MELKHNHLTRQLDLIPVGVLGMPINIIGCGALGSFVSLQLAKMGFTNQAVWDHDEVSVENMSNQFFRFKDIGQNKALALRELVKDFTGAEIKAMPIKWDRITQSHGLSGIVLSMVDDMTVRREIYEGIKEKAFHVKYMIDARMGAEVAAMYAFEPFKEEHQKMYEATLYSNAEAVQERCTAKSTIYTVNILTGLVSRCVKNIACKENYTHTLQWDLALAYSTPAAPILLAFSAHSNATPEHGGASPQPDAPTSESSDITF